MITPVMGLMILQFYNQGEMHTTNDNLKMLKIITEESDILTDLSRGRPFLLCFGNRLISDGCIFFSSAIKLSLLKSFYIKSIMTHSLRPITQK